MSNTRHKRPCVKAKAGSAGLNPRSRCLIGNALSCSSSPRLLAIPSNRGNPANDVIACFVVETLYSSRFLVNMRSPVVGLVSGYGAFYCFTFALPTKICRLKFDARPKLAA